MKTIFAAAILGLAIVTGVQAQGTTQSNVDLSTVPLGTACSLPSTTPKT